MKRLASEKAWGDYPPPSNVDAERMLLGAVLCDREAFQQIADLVTADDFWLEKNQRIFLRMTELHERGEHIGSVMLANELQKHGQLESVDGVSYIVSLNDIGQIANLESPCLIVRQKAMLRRTIALCHDLAMRCLTEADAPEDLLADAERAVEILSSAGTPRQKARTVEEIIQDAGGINDFLQPEKKPGIAVPFRTLHETLGGLPPERLVVIAARTAVGKTAIVGQISECASAAGHRVVWVSQEMSAPDILLRSIAGRANVSAYRLRQGRLSPLERAGVQRETNELVNLGDRLRIVDSDITISGIAALLRSLAARGSRTDLLVIDYLQLLSSADRYENRVQEVAALSRGLKKISRQFRIPVVALSQLIRQPSTEEPQLHWLKESGAIEQDADAVVFLWLRDEPKEADAVREVFWKVGKNRHGLLNRGRLNFYPKFCRFEEPPEEKGAAA
jgi:replicative DNA helicase